MFSLKYILFIIIFVILCAYLFGIILISVFKSKLNNDLENFENNVVKSALQKVFEEEEKKQILKESSIQETIQKNIPSNSDDIIVQKTYIEKFENPNVKQNVSNSFLSKESQNDSKIHGISNSDLLDTNTHSVGNFDYEKHDFIQNICFKNHLHNKECSYGNTNYADPRTMSDIDKRTFVLNYPPNMTMQDYVNWLYCFLGKEDQLPYNHLKNLEKLKKNIPLIKEEGVCPPPAQYFPPLDAEKYFQNMYNSKTQELSFAPKLNSNTSSLLGANYNQYSEFSQNFDVLGSTGKIVNPDIAFKKKASYIDNIIIPKNGNDLQLEEEYKPFFVKKIEV